MPKLSVVIAAVSGETTAGKCVASLRRLARGDNVDVVVVPAQAGWSICALRSRGAERASGDRIAILGDRYEVTPGWLETLEEDLAFDALGGCVAPSPHLGYIGWSIYLTEYSHVAPPLKEGPIQDPKALPGGNVVYRRVALERFKLAACRTELEFHRRLLDAGATLGINGTMEVHFAAAPGFFAYIAERFRFSHVIAAGRGQGWRIVLTPALPFLVLARTAAAVFGKGRYRLRWVICAPMIFFFGLVQASGELPGYLRLRGR